MSQLSDFWTTVTGFLGHSQAPSGIRRRRQAAKVPSALSRARYALNWRSLAFLDLDSKYKLHLVAVEK